MELQSKFEEVILIANKGCYTQSVAIDKTDIAINKKIEKTVEDILKKEYAVSKLALIYKNSVMLFNTWYNKAKELEKSLYTKEQVEELLRKQRELCIKKARFKEYTFIRELDVDSIRNAVLKF